MMKVLIPENRIPSLRRALMEKLLQMFDAETTFEISFEEHFNKKGVLTSTERLVTVKNKQSEETVSIKEFFNKTELARIFHLESSKEQATFIKKLEKRIPATLADLVEILIVTKVCRKAKPSNNF